MKARKYLWGLLTMLMVAILSVNLTACGSDDDDEGGEPSSTIGIIDQQSGLRLKSFNNYRFNYTNNQLNSITGSSFNVVFSYNPNKLNIQEGGNNAEEFNVDYNGKGFLSKVTGTYVETDNYEQTTNTVTETFSYDGNGHLTRIKSELKFSGTYDGEKENGETDGSIDFTWKNNILTQISSNIKYVENGETSSETATYVFAYNDVNKNAFNQWTPSLCRHLFDDSVEELLAYVGLLGVGPSQLPSSLVYSFVDSEGSDEETYNFTYAYNSNGAISTTYINRTSYTFGYDNVSVSDGTRSSLFDTPFKSRRLLVLTSLHKHKNMHK